jgi:hypothetical protein
MTTTERTEDGLQAGSERWPSVEWDDDGYPLAESDDFAGWDNLSLDFVKAARFLLDELPFAATQCCCACSVEDGFDELFGDRRVKRIEFSTGGWSGAESLIGFIESRLDTRHFMLSWRRGGHYVFEIPKRFYAEGEPA